MRVDVQREESRMKRYLGDRTIDGVKVTVDGAPLDPCLDVMEFTKNGFEWSYEGPEPRQLALALLVDHLADNAVVSWNPHCGHCFYCDRASPILCEEYLGGGPKGRAFDGESRAMLADGRELQQLMFLGCFSEYCIVSDQQAIPVPKEIPFDRACLIGCGVMTGAGAALNLGAIAHGDCVMVIGCGAVGLAAVQGARLAGAGAIIAVDIDAAKLVLAARMGATL